MNPEVTRLGLLDCQVCVPKDYTDAQVLEYAERANPAGTNGGWAIRKEGSEYLQGAPERMPCEERKNFVHIMLDA